MVLYLMVSRYGRRVHQLEDQAIGYAIDRYLGGLEDFFMRTEIDPIMFKGGETILDLDLGSMESIDILEAISCQAPMLWVEPPQDSESPVSLFVQEYVQGWGPKM